MKEAYSKSNSRGLYIALAICIVAIVCIGVYSAIMNAVSIPEDPIVRPSQTVNLKPKPTKAPAVTLPKQTARPAHSSASAVVPNTTDSLSVSVNNSAKRIYTKPVKGNVTKEFSSDVLVYSVTMNDYRVHNGIDISASVGNPVSAFCDGEITGIYEDPLMGHTVVVDHGEGLVSVYSNLSSVFPKGIEVGAKVKSGEVIAGVGESALIECADTCHLHFEVMKDNVYVDPNQYLEMN
jgi:murein DD-endopeptidase MepM/ murein hydrolase activator NlpD